MHECTSGAATMNGRVLLCLRREPLRRLLGAKCVTMEDKSGSTAGQVWERKKAGSWVIASGLSAVCGQTRSAA